MYRLSRQLSMSGHGTFNVLEAAVNAKVQKVVAASSASVYGAADEFPTNGCHHPYKNRTIYGAAKTFNEAMLRSFNDMYGLDYVALRYFNVYGPRMDIYGVYTEVLIRWMERIESGQPPLIFGDPTNARDFTYVTDTVRGILDAACCDQLMGETINIAYGKPRTVAEVAEIVLKATGRADLTPARERARPGDVHMHYADTTKADKMIGWEPSIALEQGIPMLLEHLKRSGADFKKMLAEEQTFNWE